MPVAANSVLAKWAINESSEIEARKEWAHPFLPPSGIQIIDIRRSAVETNVKEDIHTLFNPKKGPRKLPTLLLYDEKGLQLFEKAGATSGREYESWSLLIFQRLRTWKNTT